MLSIVSNYNSLGYIKIARKIIDSKIWSKPPLYMKVWMYLLLRAQHTNYKQLQPGQLFTSTPEIIEACSHYIGARKVKPTKDQIFQIINWLRKPDEGGHESNAKATMIATTKATHGMLVTICNYNYYQDSQTYESNRESNDENATKARRKQRQSDNINKNDNNANNDKNNILYRQENFFKEVMTFEHTYDKSLLKKFFNYWSEKDSGKNKMRWELEKVFEISKRLATWLEKKNLWQPKKNYSGSKTREPAQEFGNWNNQK